MTRRRHEHTRAAPNTRKGLGSAGAARIIRTGRAQGAFLPIWGRLGQVPAVPPEQRRRGRERVGGGNPAGLGLTGSCPRVTGGLRQAGETQGTRRRAGLTRAARNLNIRVAWQGAARMLQQRLGRTGEGHTRWKGTLLAKGSRAVTVGGRLCRRQGGEGALTMSNGHGRTDSMRLEPSGATSVDLRASNLKRPGADPVVQARLVRAGAALKARRRLRGQTGTVPAARNGQEPA